MALGDHLARLQRERTQGDARAFEPWEAYTGTRETCLEVTFHADPAGAVCRVLVPFPPPDPALDPPVAGP